MRSLESSGGSARTGDADHMGLGTIDSCSKTHLDGRASQSNNA